MGMAPGAGFDRPSGPLLLIAALAAAFAGCSPETFFDDRFDGVVTQGRGRWSVQLGGEQPVRRRFHVRLFNHFLHPRSEISTLIRIQGDVGDPSELILDRSVSIDDFLASPRLDHRLEDELRFEVASSGRSSVNVLLESSHFVGQPVPSATFDDLATFEVRIDEREPDRLVLGAPRHPEEPGDRRPFPAPTSTCASNVPRPILPSADGLGLRVEAVAGSFVTLAGAGLDASSEVQFSLGPEGEFAAALEVEALGPERVRARAPILSAGPITVAVRSGAGAERLVSGLQVPERVLKARPMPPLAAVVAAVDDGQRRFVASADTVLEVTPDGFVPGPVFSSPFGVIHDLSLSRERPGELWVAASQGLFRAVPDGASFERILAGDFRTTHEPRPGLVVAGGRPTLALSFDEHSSLRTWSNEMIIERLAFVGDGSQPVALAVSDRNELWLGQRGGRSPWAQQRLSQIRDVAASPRTCGVLVAVGDGGAYERRDDEVGWADLAGPARRLVTSETRVFALSATHLWEWLPGRWSSLAELPADFQLSAVSLSPDARRMDIYGVTGRIQLEALLEAPP